MTLITASITLACFSLAGFFIVFVKHILLKRELIRLREDMKRHTVEKGIDDELWDMFIQRTRKMLRFWQ